MTRGMSRMHRSVMLDEVIENFGPIEGRRFADLTFGEGGHTEALLRAGAAEVVGLDQDRSTLERYLEQGEFRADPRLRLVHGRISSFRDDAFVGYFDGILADLGVSTRQLLTAERGFSFQQEGPLDMRMDTDDAQTLSSYLVGLEPDDLALGLKRTVELEGARGVARRVIDRHRRGELKTTLDLARCVRPRPGSKTHPATVLFLGLRMLLNREWEEVAEGLPETFAYLRIGGRLSAISFHSVEDRLVKRSWARLAGRCICSDSPCSCPRIVKGKLVSSKPILPSESELRENPRARSAKLRVIERTI